MIKKYIRSREGPPIFIIVSVRCSQNTRGEVRDSQNIIKVLDRDFQKDDGLVMFKEKSGRI